MNASDIALCGREDYLAAFRARRSHAVLLIAPDDVGRFRLAEAAARIWGAMPPPYVDLWAVQAPVPIDAVREAMRQAAEAPFAALARVWLIEGAEHLTPVVQNALLRFVEEPPPHVRFLFTARHATALLPTLRSRLAVDRLRPLDFPRFRACLECLGIPPEEARLLYPQSQGWPVRALALREARADVPWQVAERGEGTFCLDALAGARDPQQTLSRLRGLVSRGTIPHAVELKALKRLAEAEVQLGRNQQPELVLENVFLDLEALGVFRLGSGS